MPAPFAPPPRLRLAVDDAGEFLVVVGERATIGHSRSSDVTLPFLADVSAHHARLELVEDFHAGPRWRIAPEPGARVEVGGHAVPENGTLLHDGDDVRLAANLSFRFVAKERGSASARLELSGGQECCGAPRILLLAPGPGGRARIGASSARLIPLPDVQHEIEIAADRGPSGTSLSVRCAAGVHGTPREAGEPEVRLALPLLLAVTLTARARASGKPPFALVLSPSCGTLER